MEEVIFHHRPQVRLRPHAWGRNHVELQRQVRTERIHMENDILSYISNDEDKVGVYINEQPLTRERCYFEIEILDSGLLGNISIGLVPYRYPMDCQPGWNVDSVGYHAADGRLFKMSGQGRPFGAKCLVGDRMGCGIKFEQTEANGIRHLIKVFFTRNGEEVGTVLVPCPQDGFFPCVGLYSEGEEVKLNLDAEWNHDDIILMAVDNYEDEWSRLHQVRLNGMLLEYTGRGNRIVDVGLAQARSPLDTTYHYFEIEIIDPGENCYIAIGLARRDYPKHRHPGWNQGSIAYHADDGKLFVGSGIGEPFGPRCHKGDRMGCGILFPMDYSEDMDSDGSGNNSPDNFEEIDDIFEAEDFVSDSEDDEWWASPALDTKIKVFFTRNGKTIGQREMKIPRGGFFPTIGMLSSDEKVKVDLRPLTG